MVAATEKQKVLRYDVKFQKLRWLSGYERVRMEEGGREEKRRERDWGELR